MTKPEIVTKLTELGIEHDPSVSKAELEALLPKEETKVSEKTSAVVTYPGGSREYSLAVHGEKFLDLAKQFAEKHKGVLA